MESTDALLEGLASGDISSTGMKRDQDSADDFEHLERDIKQDAGESPLHQHRSVTQSFLDMERTPAPTATVSVVPDHVADKFTDSESDADTAGESPLHRPASKPEATPEPTAPTPEPRSLTPEQPTILAHDPTPVLAPALAPVLTPAPATASEPATTPLSMILPVPAPNEQVPLVTTQAPVPSLVHTTPTTAPIAPSNVEKLEEPEKKQTAVPEPKLEMESEIPTRAPTAHVIEAEVIFCQMGLDTWFDPQRLHPKVESLIYWRSVPKSGAALGAGLVLLVALACCSVVSVLSYASLLVLSAAVAFRIYKNVLQAVQKTNDGHPFKWLLEKDIGVPAERAQSVAAAATAHLNALLHELRSLFLVEDLVDSLKFGVMLWCGTYVGACFNGITLIILGWIGLFTLPKAYEMNKDQVDANLELARSKINEISAKVRAAVPLGRKSETDKDK